jgi:hypothetical protein
MRTFLFDALLWIFASPWLFLRSCIRFLRRIKYWRVAYATQIACIQCRSTISLVGMWRCGCGYTYTGHLLRRCPLCRSLPRTARCFTCGVSRLLPEEV